MPRAKGLGPGVKTTNGTGPMCLHFSCGATYCCLSSGRPVSEPGAAHPGAVSSEAARRGEQGDTEDHWQVSVPRLCYILPQLKY